MPGTARFTITDDGKFGFGDNAPYQQMEIKGGSASWSLGGSESNVDNLYLEDMSGADGLNAVEGSISFSGAMEVTYSPSARRHAAIAGIQTDASENDFVGLAFFTHNSSTSTGDIWNQCELCMMVE